MTHINNFSNLKNTLVPFKLLCLEKLKSFSILLAVLLFGPCFQIHMLGASGLLPHCSGLSESASDGVRSSVTSVQCFLWQKLIIRPLVGIGKVFGLLLILRRTFGAQVNQLFKDNFQFCLLPKLPDSLMPPVGNLSSGLCMLYKCMHCSVWGGGSLPSGTSDASHDVTEQVPKWP